MDWRIGKIKGIGGCRRQADGLKKKTRKGFGSYEDQKTS